ncbi:MAG: 23S rRNA (uracil(1939)-C(5))-methyltransferase RlmD [Bacteroidales bacterium]|nr:23S rRNA (uracil(1939)-C(5))-methyltransferase RlmD [Bacteroidales bacterium]
MKKRQEIILRDVTITGAGSEGNAVARIDGMVVFVPYAAPGDVVDLRIVRKKKSFAEGRIIELKQASPLRVEPPCPHFGICGGCRWQHLDYKAQLDAKQQQVVDNLQRIGHLDTKLLRPICGSDKIYRYRNKLEFTFSTRRWRSMEELQARDEEQPLQGREGSRGDECPCLGFHAPQVFDKVIPIEQCLLQEEPSNAIRNFVRDYALQHQLPFYDLRNHTGLLRNIVIRSTSTGQWMVILIVAEERDDLVFPLLDAIAANFKQITSLQYIVNSKLNDSYADLPVTTYRGADHIEECMHKDDGTPDLHFNLAAKSFYQTNPEQAQRLYSYVQEFATDVEAPQQKTLYDLYTGTGTIALFLARGFKKVVGIEYVEQAVADARINAMQNGIDNATFYAGDMAKVLTEEFIAANGRPDIVVTDPPRAGMHERVVEQLLATRPMKIVYVSCNSATQARDIALLSTAYTVGRIQPVDMFPHTHHVENIVELWLRD